MNKNGKKKKQETDNDTRDRTDERKKFVREQMKQFAKTSRGSSSSHSSSKKTEEEKQTKSEDKPDKDTSGGEPTENKATTVSTDTEEDVHPHPLLSGVAKFIEKEKKTLKRREKKRNLYQQILMKRKVMTNPKKRKRRRSHYTIKIIKITILGHHRQVKPEMDVHT